MGDDSYGMGDMGVRQTNGEMGVGTLWKIWEGRGE